MEVPVGPCWLTIQPFYSTKRNIGKADKNTEDAHKIASDLPYSG